LPAPADLFGTPAIVPDCRTARQARACRWRTRRYSRRCGRGGSKTDGGRAVQRRPKAGFVR